MYHQNPVEYFHVSYEPANDDYLLQMPIKASFHELQEWIFGNYGFTASYKFVNYVKQKHGIARPNDAKALRCPPEIEAAIEAALRHFRMI